jgi:hypothetical protein
MKKTRSRKSCDTVPLIHFQQQASWRSGCPIGSRGNHIYITTARAARGRILGRNPDKSFKSFPPLNSLPWDYYFFSLYYNLLQFLQCVNVRTLQRRKEENLLENHTPFQEIHTEPQVWYLSRLCAQKRQRNYTFMNSASGNIVVVVSGVAVVAEDADVSYWHMGATTFLRCTSFYKGSCGPPTGSCRVATPSCCSPPHFRFWLLGPWNN